MATPENFIKALKSHMGVKYTYGGKTPESGLDCSGLITYSLKQVGIDFPNGSTNQIVACTPISVEQALKTPGALLWFQGHDAISLGDGKTIEAVTTPKNGVGSYPHGGRFIKAGLIPGIDYESKKDEPMGKMVSPFAGRVTAQWRGYKNHAGMDIAPPKPGQVGLPVYAVFGGTVVRVARGVKAGNRKSTWAPGRTGNGVLVRNPDGEGNGYNHVNPVVKAGQKVKAGDLIGYNDRSGNQTGPHLHLELWADWRNSNSDYDPRRAFTKFGVVPGSNPVTSGTSGDKPSVIRPSASKPSAKVPEPSAKVKGYLKKMGLPPTVNGVKAYQKQHNLRPDGVWGSITQDKYNWVVKLQKALNLMKRSAGVQKVVVDGYQGNGTNRLKNDILKRNKWTNNNLVANLKAVRAWK